MKRLENDVSFVWLLSCSRCDVGSDVKSLNQRHLGSSIVKPVDTSVVHVDDMHSSKLGPFSTIIFLLQ